VNGLVQYSDSQYCRNSLERWRVDGFKQGFIVQKEFNNKLDGTPYIQLTMEDTPVALRWLNQRKMRHS